MSALDQCFLNTNEPFDRSPGELVPLGCDSEGWGGAGGSALLTCSQWYVVHTAFQRAKRQRRGREWMQTVTCLLALHQNQACLFHRSSHSADYLV